GCTCTHSINPRLIHPTSSRACLFCTLPGRYLYSFPTRRSSDLRDSGDMVPRIRARCVVDDTGPQAPQTVRQDAGRPRGPSEFSEDRKSTRLNSSHVSNSYAVSCLRKKTKKKMS